MDSYNILNLNLLQLLESSSNMDNTDILKLVEQMRINEVKKLHTYAINQLGDGRFKTNVRTDKGRKAIYGRSEIELWRKLADWYTEKEKSFEEAVTTAQTIADVNVAIDTISALNEVAIGVPAGDQNFAPTASSLLM